MAALEDTIRRDVREIAEEISATAAAETLGMTTELAKRETRIAQLGSRIEDLQVQQRGGVAVVHVLRPMTLRRALDFPCARRAKGIDGGITKVSGCAYFLVTQRHTSPKHGGKSLF